MDVFYRICKDFINNATWYNWINIIIIMVNLGLIVKYLTMPKRKDIKDALQVANNFIFGIWIIQVLHLFSIYAWISEDAVSSIGGSTSFPEWTYALFENVLALCCFMGILNIYRYTAKRGIVKNGFFQ